MKAAIYARFSSDNQREESIAAQIRSCSSYARQHGMVIVKTYKDEARSGKTADRPEFQRMIKDARLSLFDILLVDKQDRFARNRYDFAVYKRELRLCGVRVISVKQPLDDSRPEAVIMEAMLEAFAEYYSRNLAEETLKGLKENAYQAKFTGGVPLLGYDVDPVSKRYVINEKEAEAVRLIFNLFTKGYSYRHIQSELDRLGYRTKRGNRFGANAIYEILRNEKYVGVFVYNMIAAADESGKRNSHRRKDPSEIIRVPGGCPAIIDEVTWRKVREAMEARRHSPWAHPKAKEPYLLTGKVWCGECGAAMVGASSYARGKRYTYYACNRKMRTKDCPSKKIRQEELESYVLSQLEKKLFSTDRIPALIDTLKDYQKGLNRRLAEEEKRARDELRKVGSEINNLVDLLAAQGRAVFESVKDRLASLEEQKARLETRLAELEFEAPLGQIEERHIRDFVHMNAVVLQTKDPVQLQDLIHTYVDKITVYRDRVEVELVINVAHTSGAVGAV